MVEERPAASLEMEESGETAVVDTAAVDTAAEVVTSPPSVVEEHPLFKRIEQGDLESIQNFLEVC